MKVLFIAGLYPIGSESYYNSALKRGSLANPSNVYQWGVVEGLLANNIDVEVCSFPFLPTYPSGYKFTKTREEDIIFQNTKIGRAYSYNTIPGIKEIDIICKLKKVIKHWILTFSESEKGYILIYSLYGPFLNASISTSTNYDRIKVCPIVTDLFISSIGVLRSYPFLKKIQGVFEYGMIKRGLKKADTFVLLAKAMVKYVPRAINNHVIIEGIAGNGFPKPKTKRASVEKSLLYTGSLGVHTSIKELVDAFMMTSDKSFRLLICGTGYYETYIREMSQKDNRIVYKGSVPREEAVRLQQSSTVLINPRLPSIPDTPYSFPSKTIEYLASGTPMIGYRLVGITQDYYEFFYIPKDETKEALSELINEVLNTPQEILDQKALDSWEFITSQKTSFKQIKKLVDYLMTLQ